MANWKAELAQAEAAAWLKAHKGWDAGMPAELPGLKEVPNAELPSPRWRGLKVEG